ncbi:MAG: hypothetical protein ABEJ24_05465 [Candidatus Magasanikbacteria bacterium]
MSPDKPANPQNQQKPGSQNQQQANTNQNTSNQSGSSGNSDAATCAVAGCGGIMIVIIVIILAVIGGAAYVWYSNMFGVQDYFETFQKASSGEIQSVEDLPVSESQINQLKESGVIEKIKQNPEQFKKCAKEELGTAKMMKILSQQSFSQDDLKQIQPCLQQ